MKKLALILSVFMVLSMFAFAACDLTQEAETETEKTNNEEMSSEKETITDTEEEKTTVEEEVTDSLGHVLVDCEEVAPTQYVSGFTGGKYCSICEKIYEPRQIIPSLSTPDFPSSSKVTEEEWKNAFDLIRLNSFTMLYQQKSMTKDFDYETYDDLTEENFLGYVTTYQIDGTVRYNNGNISISSSGYSGSSASETETVSGQITFDPEKKFREVDYFSNSLRYGIQPAECLDDTIYDWEDYGYYMATYSDEINAYVIEFAYSSTVTCRVEISFENGNLIGYRAIIDERYRRNETCMLFSDINANKPVTD